LLHLSVQRGLPVTGVQTGIHKTFASIGKQAGRATDLKRAHLLDRESPSLSLGSGKTWQLSETD